MGGRYEIKEDGYGTRWVVLDDRDFEDLVATIHLAAVFGFDYKGKRAYWVYNMKRGRFYPFVLAGEKERDNAAEMRLGALMEEEKILVEGSLERWYALWGIPF